MAKKQSFPLSENITGPATVIYAKRPADPIAEEQSSLVDNMNETSKLSEL
jgi:hypothetical protein